MHSVNHRPASKSWRYYSRILRLAALLIVSWLFVGIVRLFYINSPLPQPPKLELDNRYDTEFSSILERVPCIGPRGRLLSDSPDDELRYGNLTSTPYPVPFMGSHRELHLKQSWITADGRYGPYGFRDDTDQNTRGRVDWDEVDWGMLQNDCFERNQLRFPEWTRSANFTTEPRLGWKNLTQTDATPDPTSVQPTRRTALLIRSWANYDYKPEDLWNIRSLITEAALGTGSDYHVFLYVHIQDRDKNIFSSQERYDAAFAEANIPPELQSIAILWDDNLLESWYDKIEEHRTIYQVNQPVQLFALQYPEFDHYWQIEMDQRFLGHVGEYLDAVAAFTVKEPRKQAIERASFAFHDEIYNTYENFTKQVDMANMGKTRAWGPLRIPEIQPNGPQPPVPEPMQDNFTWGVGEEADVVVSSFCADVVQTTWWVFYKWIAGFSQGLETPRWYCPPAIMRGSRRLFLTVHEAQCNLGLSVPSEATLPSWALWHGLKLSYPPHPAYMRPHRPAHTDAKADWTRDPAKWLDTTITPWFGNTTEHSTDGIAHADPMSEADLGMSFWWRSQYPREIFDKWIRGDTEARNIPDILAVQNGRIYAPNFMLHPVKS